MTIQVSAFRNVPDFARGQVRDLRVRWALEEAGIPYTTKLIGQGEHKSDAYRQDWQPFGQVPAIHEDGLHLFESGAIVLHIGEKSEVLIPKDAAGRAKAIQWLLCALNTIEAAVQQYGELLFFKDQEWTRQRRPQLEERVRLRLGELSKALGTRDYLDGRFTAGYLMMSTVFRIVNDTDFVKSIPNLAAYHARCEARPAFQRALKGQLDDLDGNRSAA